MDRCWLCVALLLVPVLGGAQGGFDFQVGGFVERNITIQDVGLGIAPSFRDKQFSGLVYFTADDGGVADPQVFDFEIDVTLENGLRFVQRIPFDTVVDNIDPPVQVVSGAFSTIFVEDEPIAALPIEGDDEFSRDTYVLRADIGIGAVLASQFRPRLAPAETLSADPQALVASLQAGPLRNELYAVRANFGSSAVSFGTQYRVDDGSGQITDHNVYKLGTRIQFLKSKGNASGYIHVWDAFGSGTDNSLRGIQARRSDGDGQPQGSQFQVNTFIDGDQFGARVAGNDESFVVVWTSQGSPGDDDSGTSIQARRFTLDGTPLGDQFQVNQATMGDQFEPAIAMAADGRFIVTWTDRPLVTSNVLARVYGADGMPAADAFPLSTDPGADLSRVAIAGSDALVTWRQGTDLLSRASLDGVFADGFEN